MVNEMITALAVRIQTRIHELHDRDDRGATAAEYGLIIGVTVVAVGASIFFLGDNIQNFFQNAVDAFDDNSGTP